MVRPIVMKIQSVKGRRATPKKVVEIKVIQSPPKKKTTTRSIVVLTGSKRGKFNWMAQALADRKKYPRGKKTSVVVKKTSQVKAVGLPAKEVKRIMKPFRG